MMKKKIDYKYNESNNILELLKYVNSTYEQHYSKNKFQATEFIIDGGHGEGFCIGNIMKYAQRYGNKNGYNRQDLLKVIHYGSSDVFNIGNENEITILNLAETIIKLTNSNSKIILKDLPLDDPKQRKPDLTKAKNLLDFQPQTSLEDGLKITIDWVSKQL